MKIYEGITFDDVLIVPKISNVLSRKETDTSTNLTDNIKLSIPIISANMDTVTESAMAITMARLGGVGVIHRFNTIEEQVNEVKKVKRKQGVIISDPYTVSPEDTLSKVKELAAEKGVTGFPVVIGSKLVGIITKRDYILEEDMTRKVKELMTKDPIVADENITINKAKSILKKNKIEKLLLVDKEGRLKGMITAKDISINEADGGISKDKKGRLMVGAAIGIVGDYKERADKLVEAEADFIVVDVANGYLTRVADVVKYLKKNYDIEVIAGNVATKEGAINLAKAGADAVKVGIGPGGACLTRSVAGVGYPQLSAIMECSVAGVRIIADGGITKSADLAKAIAGGADAVMIGSLLSGTDESPGKIVAKENKNYKIYRGMASISAYADKAMKQNELLDIEGYTPEGTEMLVEYKGSAIKIINNLVNGLKSAMTYVNARNLNEFRKNVEFVRLTESGKKESKYI
ncbi:MAG: IMP dehydrogenase [Candidatus Micrarchaeia archaeon]|jgi:IMP dehydrogenase